MKIVILDSATVTAGDISYAPIEKLGDVAVYDQTPHDCIVSTIGDAEVVLCNKTPLFQDVLDACPKLRYIGLFATGYNNVDTVYAAKRGITVCNAPNYSTEAVAQFAFALILQHYSKVGEYAASVNAGKWIDCSNFSYFLSSTYELKGRTIGLIGFGSIGRKMAQLAHAFDMEVIVYSRTRKPELENEHLHFVSLEELLATSDIVSIHCPLNEQTRGLINAESLAKMKQGAVLINTARGPIVDEQALADALNSGRIAGCGLDVLANEPMRADNPLVGAKNCIITPHVAWSPMETRERLIEIVADNIASYLAGRPKNVVI